MTLVPSNRDEVLANNLMPRVPKSSNLTIRERGFIADLIKGKNIRKAVMKNYNTKKPVTASQLGYTMMQKPRIQYAILDMMDKLGVSDLALVEKMKEHIFNAQREVLNKDGDVVKLSDNTSSLQALDMAMKIKGAYAPERHEHMSMNVNIYKDLSDEELNRQIKVVEAREAFLAQGEGEEIGS